MSIYQISSTDKKIVLLTNLFYLLIEKCNIFANINSSFDLVTQMRKFSFLFEK